MPYSLEKVQLRGGPRLDLIRLVSSCESSAMVLLVKITDEKQLRVKNRARPTLPVTTDNATNTRHGKNHVVDHPYVTSGGGGRALRSDDRFRQVKLRTSSVSCPGPSCPFTDSRCVPTDWERIEPVDPVIGLILSEAKTFAALQCHDLRRALYGRDS